MLRLTGIEPGQFFPLITNCPLCRSASKLEVRTPFFLVCRGCWFTGDVIQFLAVHRKATVELTVQDLVKRGLLDMSPAELGTYYDTNKLQAQMKGLWLKQSDFLRHHGDTAALYAALAGIKSRPTHQQLCALLPHVCYLQREQLQIMGFEPPEHSIETWNWWSRYSALAVPCWDGGNINGFWLLTTKGSNYLGIDEHQAAGTAFGLVASTQDEQVVVVDQLETAIKYSLWSSIETGRVWPFVCNYGLRDRTENYRAKRVVYWSTVSSTRHYLRSLPIPGTQILLVDDVQLMDSERLPLDGSFGSFTVHLRTAMPAHQACSQHLLTADEDEVRSALAATPVDPANRAQILAYVQGDDQRRLTNFFGDGKIEQTISWNGRTIVDTPQGWLCKGEVISSIKFYIEQIRPYGSDGDAKAIGTIVFTDRRGERHVLSFDEKLAKLRKNTAGWLQDMAVSATGQLPYVDSKWKGRLLEIAQQFHLPTPIMGQQLYGWDGQRLRMPYFVVDDKMIIASQTLVEGPLLPVPAPLSPAEWGAMKNPGFCRIVLALLGNLLRTRQGRPGMGLMLTNEPHVLTRIAKALGAEVLANPTVDTVEVHAHDPLPLFTEWSPLRLRQLFEMKGLKNCMISVDKHTDKLAMITPDWLHLRVGDTLDYSALRVIFLLLPDFLRSGSVDIDAEDFYRNIAQFIGDTVLKECAGHRLAQAAIDLDQYFSSRNSTSGSRVVDLMFYGIDRGDFQPIDHYDAIEVKHQDFSRTLASTSVVIPSIGELTTMLQDARFLVKDSSTSWFISKMSWNVLKSLSAVR